MSIKVIIPELKRRAVGRDDAGQRRYDSSLQNYFHCFYLMLLHRQSNVNRSNDMKSLVGYYVNTPEGTFSSGMKNFLLLQTFDFYN